MVYNPIFEEELAREKQIRELRRSIKLRASKDQVRDLCGHFSTFVKAHPVFSTLALGAFGVGLMSSRK